ncbi:MAG: pyruvate, water dikinase, partial [Actinomycetota bacterium]|nr:pyruvate, water dikinase [Actinomycetota bacterium]
MHDTRYIQFFDGGHDADIEILGGKGASLVSMTAADMPVPPGFVVTTRAYAAFLHETGLDATIHRWLSTLDPDDHVHVDAVAAEIRAEMESRPVPDELRAQTYLAFHDLMERFGREVPVAVRSSATAEDLPDASFAGQQDTYLWVMGIYSVTDYIRRCWASLYTARAITYRLKHNIPDEGLSMAVVVQKMVNAKASGVAITMNPGTGDRSKITIDASYGVGEMVVSGQVTPDNIVLDKVMMTIISEHIGDKHAELVPDPASQGLVEREVEPERAARRCLTDAEVILVGQMAKNAEKHYKCPQDVEWALDADLPDGQNLLLL